MFSFYINKKVSFENISTDKKGICYGRTVIKGDKGAEPFGANAEFDLHDGPPFQSFVGSNVSPFNNGQFEAVPPYFSGNLNSAILSSTVSS
jgi:hypothetical protein